MELRTFVTTALLDIVSGVKDAQNQTESGTIVPGGIGKNLKTLDSGFTNIQSIDFEVCVTAEETKGSEAKLGVVSSLVGAGVAGSSSNEKTHSSTLKFRIPIKLPSSGNIHG